MITIHQPAVDNAIRMAQQASVGEQHHAGKFPNISDHKVVDVQLVSEPRHYWRFQPTYTAERYLVVWVRLEYNAAGNWADYGIGSPDGPTFGPSGLKCSLWAD